MSTPTEIKAQAIAHCVMGRSCREVQRRLRKQFPYARIPHHSTIARWLNKVAGEEAMAAPLHWSLIHERVAGIVLERLETEGTQMSLLDAAKLNSIVSATYWNSRERQRRLARGV